MAPCSWWSLPTEMQLQIVGLLEWSEIKQFSQVDTSTYSLCVPALFRETTLPSYESLLAFLDRVPTSYYRYVQSLVVCTKPKATRNIRGCALAQTGLLSKLLCLATSVERLTLQVYGSPARSIIPCFERLTCLRSLHLSNSGDDRVLPLSERLVVAIALSVPQLEDLTLDRVARSSMHAPDLVGSYPYIPIVSGDEDIADHAMVGSSLCLPSILHIPTLRKLCIRDTHLADPLWETAVCTSPLVHLDLGSCYHGSPETSQIAVERIINNIGEHCNIDQLAVNTKLENTRYKDSDTPLKSLRHLRLTAFFPIDDIVDTLVTLAGSPIETLCIQCYEDDITDVCSSIQEFLDLRVDRGPESLYPKLGEISISFVPIEGDVGMPVSTEPSMSFLCESTLDTEQIDDIIRFQKYCRELGSEGAAEEGFSGRCVIRLGGGITSVDQGKMAEMKARAEPILGALPPGC